MSPGIAQPSRAVQVETPSTFNTDKAFSTHANHNVLETFGVAAYIPFKDNTGINLKFPVWSCHLYEFLPYYHRRSNVETVFTMIRPKFGAAVRSRLAVATSAHQQTRSAAPINVCF